MRSTVNYLETGEAIDRRHQDHQNLNERLLSLLENKSKQNQNNPFAHANQLQRLT